MPLMECDVYTDHCSFRESFRTPAWLVVGPFTVGIMKVSHSKTLGGSVISYLISGDEVGDSRPGGGAPPPQSTLPVEMDTLDISGAPGRKGGQDVILTTSLNSLYVLAGQGNYGR